MCGVRVIVQWAECFALHATDLVWSPGSMVPEHPKDWVMSAESGIAFEYHWLFLSPPKKPYMGLTLFAVLILVTKLTHFAFLLTSIICHNWALKTNAHIYIVLFYLSHVLEDICVIITCSFDFPSLVYFLFTWLFVQFMKKIHKLWDNSPFTSKYSKKILAYYLQKF